MAKSFRELQVWERGIELTVLVYAATSEFPKTELYGLCSQMRRAAVSMASNIAEGSARNTKKDFVSSSRSRGSNCELQTQMVIAQRLGYGSAAKLMEAETLSIEIGKMLSGLSKYLSATAKP